MGRGVSREKRKRDGQKQGRKKSKGDSEGGKRGSRRKKKVRGREAEEEGVG